MPPKTRPTSNLLRAIAKPDNSGLVPGIHAAAPGEGTRNKSGHDEKSVGALNRNRLEPRGMDAPNRVWSRLLTRRPGR